MVELGLSTEVPVRRPRPSSATAGEKKAGVVEHPKVFDHAGLLF
jgi:hypothetical protein